MTTTANSPTKLLRLKSVSERTGLARSTIYELIAHNDFPRQIPISARAVGWLETDVDDWISERVSAAEDK